MRALCLASISALVLIAAPAALAAPAKHPDPKKKCTILGTPHADVLHGTPGNDVICGLGGNDRINGGAGNDTIFGLAGGDRIDGGPGNDHLFGGIGADRLRGGGGRDFLYGERGTDRLSGGGGADALYGDLGNDRLHGGPGEDMDSGGPGANSGDPPGAPGVAPCPTTANDCSFSMHLDISLYCPSYSKSFGACIGRTEYANFGWSVPVVELPAVFGGFQWTDLGSGSGFYKLTQYASSVGIPQAKLEGRVPNAGSAAYTITTAWNLVWPGSLNVQWNTPNYPGVPPGKEGGPLYLNYVNGWIGADVYIDGFLFRKG